MCKLHPQLDFVKQLAQELVLPALKYRVYNYRQPLNLRNLINRIIGPDYPAEPQSTVLTPGPTGQSSKCKQFYICPAKNDRKTSQFCNKCKKPICMKCSAVVCNNGLKV